MVEMAAISLTVILSTSGSVGRSYSSEREAKGEEAEGRLAPGGDPNGIPEMGIELPVAKGLEPKEEEEATVGEPDPTVVGV